MKSRQTFSLVLTSIALLLVSIAFAGPLYPECCKYTDGRPGGPCSASSSCQQCLAACDAYCSGTGLSQCYNWCQFYRC